MLKEGTHDKYGVYRMLFNETDMTATFDKMGLKCVEQYEISDALNVREENGINPFNGKTTFFSFFILFINKKINFYGTIYLLLFYLFFC